MSVLISLLRGINVGGNKKIRMADLKDLYESLGFERVQTLLQSGNVVFTSQDADTHAVASRIEAGIVERFGFESRIIMRTAAQLQTVIKLHPFSSEQLAEPSKILVMFLESTPDADVIQALTQVHNGPETIHYSGQELYTYYPDGMGRSRLDHGLIERKLKINGTGRNWNTVNKLLALADGLGQGRL